MLEGGGEAVPARWWAESFCSGDAMGICERRWHALSARPNATKLKGGGWKGVREDRSADIFFLVVVSRPLRLGPRRRSRGGDGTRVDARSSRQAIAAGPNRTKLKRGDVTGNSQRGCANIFCCGRPQYGRSRLINAIISGAFCWQAIGGGTKSRILRFSASIIYFIHLEHCQFYKTAWRDEAAWDNECLENWIWQGI